ncbi:MAG TPA: hypothetical protein VFA15_06345, partial [Nitrososphaera sp.]|nr:hypothetical protein [Nitrososphaera sp.]
MSEPASLLRQRLWKENRGETNDEDLMLNAYEERVEESLLNGKRQLSEGKFDEAVESFTYVINNELNQPLLRPHAYAGRARAFLESDQYKLAKYD